MRQLHVLRVTVTVAKRVMQFTVAQTQAAFHVECSTCNISGVMESGVVASGHEESSTTDVDRFVPLFLFER